MIRKDNEPACQPMVSIITPVYNEAEHLAECIESVVAQTYQNWQYIIVDNCSSDTSVEIARRYAAKDSRIRVEENREYLPVLANHNRALRKVSSSSKYCKMVFADDWIFPECLERMVGVAEANPSVAIVGAYGLEDHRVIWSGLPYPSSLVSGREICRRLFLEDLYVFGSAGSVLYRADRVRSHDRFYNEANLHADSEACIELLKSYDFGFVHQVLTFQRARTASLSTFSSDIGTYTAGKLQELIGHGREFLTPAEFDTCLERVLNTYYGNLAGAFLRMRDKKFWDYHKHKLAEIGIGFSRTRLAGVLLGKLRCIVLNPGYSIGRAFDIGREIADRRRSGNQAKDRLRSKRSSGAAAV
jgi:glycosyltransferase involved in cell wall biosynthesis